MGSKECLDLDLWPEHVTSKSTGIIFLLDETPAASLLLIKWRGQKILSWQHSGLRRGVWPWPLTYDLKINSDHLLIENTPAPSLVLIKRRGQKIWSWQHIGLRRVGWEEWFDLDLWISDLKINRGHLLIEGNPCTKNGIDQVNRSKDIERTTYWTWKSGLT